MLHWIKKAPGHYTDNSGRWEIKRDGDRYKSYVIYERGLEQGAASTPKGAMLNAGKMFASIREARFASIYDASGKVIGNVS